MSEYCRICNSLIDDNNIPANCAGECDRVLVPDYQIPAEKVLNFNDDFVPHYDLEIDQPLDYAVDEYDDWVLEDEWDGDDFGWDEDHDK